jgi:zinc/manganese transport system permease protein
VWLGLVLSAMVNLPPSFFVVAVAVAVWLVVLGLTGRRREVRQRTTDEADAHHRPAAPVA